MQRGSDLIQATLDFVEYFKDVAADRRRQRRDDVALVIANSVLDGKPIGDFEAYSYCIALATAGHDSTSSTLAGGLLGLIQNPGEMRKLQENPTLIPAAVEEMVRWVSPVKPLFSRTGRGVELTNAGRILLEVAKASYARIDEALETIRDKEGVTQGNVRLATVHTLSYYFTADVVSTFVDQRPKVNLSLMARSSPAVVELVENGKAHLGFVYDSMVASPRR
jgi:LysR substrate binding domain/Cytochrome P450